MDFRCASKARNKSVMLKVKENSLEYVHGWRQLELDEDYQCGARLERTSREEGKVLSCMNVRVAGQTFQLRDYKEVG